MDLNKLLVSTDKEKLDIPFIHSFLTNAYWSKGRTLEQVRKSIENSTCFGLYLDNEQIGFARVLSDKVIFAYLMDVFIIEEQRGKGYSKYFLNKIFNYQEFIGVKKWMLATKDAHNLYKMFGFTTVTNTEKWMEK